MISVLGPLNTEVREALRAYDDFTASLLAKRQILTNEEATQFLNPSYDEHIHDPLLMKNMEKAAKRLAKAISEKEKIAVWSDYDCDGIPGGVIMHDFLKKVSANFVNYIPHRHEEGYGVNENGLEKLAKEGVTLVVTVDSGIVDVDAVAHANELGMEVIVTDHHEPGAVLPPAFAVINPKQEGETYPFRELCGAALAWKLVCATLQVGFEGREQVSTGWEKWLLDMAGLATIADMVPLVGENRVIAKYGLLVMRKSPRLGFQKLCRIARVNQRFITEDDVGFMIAPRVNAASRMGNARDAFTLFTSEDEVETDTLSKLLDKANRSRRATAGAVTKSIHSRIEDLFREKEMPPVLVMGDPEWRPALLGYVANGIADQYERPVFLWGREGSGIIKGSCRAGRKEVHVVSLMQSAKDAFIEFGGHSQSGGFAVKEDAVFTLEEQLVRAYTSCAFKPSDGLLVDADAEVNLEQVSQELLSSITRFAPFGMGNEKPVFMIRNAVLEEVSWFGKSSEHLKIKITRPSRTLEAISFFAKRELGSVLERIATGDTRTILGTLEKDQFAKGQPIRLRLVSVV